MARPPPPERIGKYKVVKRLAQGGMGEVLIGRLDGADGFQRDVVIKRVLSQHTEDSAFMTMFRDEARITAQLRHGNIAQVIEFAEDEDEFFLVLEFVDGPSLGAILQKLNRAGKLLSVAEVAHIVSETALALDYAHHKRGNDDAPLLVVHRDVSPSNILVSKEGHVKLTDFGIARARARLTPATQGEGAIKGKLAYMPPESLEGRAEARSDLFALGAVAYEMLTGAPAFAGTNEMETIHNILLGEIEKPSSINPRVPDEIDELITRMLARAPEARPARGFEVAQALNPFLLVAGEPAHERLAQTIAELFGEPPETNETEPPTVLVVDESRTMRLVLKTKLGKDYRVIEASSGKEAFELMKATTPAVVICQNLLSGTSGLEICRKLRSTEPLKKVPLILVAADVTDALQTEAEEAGANGVLSKGANREEITSAITRVVKD